MTPAAPPIAAPPADALRAALDDPTVLAGLFVHGRARLRVLLFDRPTAVRNEVAADAVQEAIRKALARRADFDPDRAAPAAWLHGFLHHVLSEHCRAVRRQPVQPATDLDDWAALEDRLADAAGLGALLGGLTAEQREIVTLHHLDGLSHREIAVRLGISEPTSRVRLARAMNELRRVAGKEGGR